MKLRSEQQNKALHKFFGNLSDRLNVENLDMRTVLKEDFEIPWSKETVSTYLVLPLLPSGLRDKTRLPHSAKVYAHTQITGALMQKGMTEPFPNLSFIYTFSDFLEDVAERLNDAGWEMRKLLPNNVKLDWTPLLVKECLWKPIQEARLSKVHTSDLTTKEIDIVYDILMRALAQRYGIVELFPSLEEVSLIKTYDK